MGSAATAELSQGADDGTDDTGPRLRKIERASPRARGPGGPHDRGGGDGQGSPGRDRLDSWKARFVMKDRDQVRELLKEDGIRFLVVQFVALHGSAKAKMVPVECFDDVVDVGAGFAGGALW